MKKYLLVYLVVLLFGQLAYAIEPSPETKAKSYLYYLKGLMYEQQQKIPEAIAVFEKLIELDPQSKYLRQELIGLYLSLGDVTKALFVAESLKKIDDKDPKTYLSLGGIYMYMNDSERAKQMYEESLKYDPKNEEALLYLAQIASGTDPERAIERYQKLLEMEPNSPEVWFSMASLYVRLKKYDEAIDACNHVINSATRKEALLIVYLTLGQIYEEKKDFDKAIETYNSAWEIDSQNVNLLLKMGAISYDQKKHADAKKYFGEVIKISPQNTESRYFLSLIAEIEKDWDKALVLFTEIIGLQKNNVQPYIHLGYIYSRKGEINKVIDILKKATLVDPNSPEVFFFLGIGYEDLKKYKEAEQAFDRAIILKPDYTDAYYHLGSVYDQQEQFEKAIIQFRKVIEMNPNYWAAYNYIGYSYADRNINLDEAYRLIKSAVDADPENGAFVDSLGWIYYRQGKNKEAIEQLEKADKLIRDPIIAEHLGDVCFAEKRYEEAADAWEKARQLNPKNPTVINKLKSVQSLVLPGTWIRKKLKYIEGNLKQIGSLEVAMDVKVTRDKNSSDLKTMFYYKQPDKVRIDFLGLFAIPHAVLLGGKDMVLYKPQGKDIGLSESETFVLAESLIKWLNCEFTVELDTAETRFSETNQVYRLIGKNVEADLDKNVPGFIRYVYTDGNNNRVELKFENYLKIEGLWLPGKIKLSLNDKKVVLEIMFSMYKINPAIDNLFQLTQP